MKKTIKILNILVILAILFNCGSLAITNYLVMKEPVEIVFYENNPVTAELYDFERPVEQKETLDLNYLKFVIHTLMIGLIIGTYIFLRYLALKKNSNFIMFLMCLCVGVMFFVNFYDISGNLGYLIGKFMGG